MSEKLERASEAYKRWRRVPLAERCAAVARGLDYFRDNREEIALEMTAQMGKPIAQARGEVDTMLARAEACVRVAPEALRPDVLSQPGDDIVRRIQHEPRGVIVDIAAWNYPLLVPTNAVVPALCAGNTVLLKHSPLTMLTGERFAAAFADCGVPDLVQNLVIDHAQAADLLGDERVAHVCFTGSVRGGLEVYQVAARRVLGVGLELGGVDPAYVAADADLEFAVAGIVDGACFNAGQSCCAIERAYVHADLYDQFVERAAALMAGYRMGDPNEESTTLGPLARAQAPRELEEQVAEAIAGGATLACGGKRDSGQHGNFFPATLVTGARPGTRLVDEESFGPVLPVVSVTGDDEALSHMNRSRFGLTASVWTSDLERAERFAAELDAGTVFQNRCDYLDPELPWSGARRSGLGSSLSRYGYYDLTQRKSIHLRTRTKSS